MAIGNMLFSLSEDYSFSFWDLYKGRFIFIEIDERRMKFLRKDNIFSSKKNSFLKSAIEELYYEEYRIKMKDGAILSRAYLFLKKEDDSSIELLDNLKIYEAIALTKHLNELVKK